MFAESLERDLRLAKILTVDMGHGQQLKQITVSALGLRQHHDRICTGPSHRPAVHERPGFVLAGQTKLATYDGLNPGLRERGGELHATEKIAGVGDRNRRHAVATAELTQILDANRALGKGVGRVNAKMDKISQNHEDMIPQLGSQVTGQDTPFPDYPRKKRRLIRFGLEFS